jgi:signal transduction histidine kinase
VELIRSHFNYYYVGLFFADENFEKLVLRAATGEMGQKLLATGHSFQIGNSSIVGWSVANNQARIAVVAEEDAVRLNNPILPLTRSELALPLRARGKVIGAMTFQSQLESAFTESDITALQTMADQVANAIENARLFDERMNLITELERKNAELEEFAYTVSHDLKSPLVTMRGFLGYLAKDAHAGDLDRFDKDLKRVIEATSRMQALLSDLLELSKIGRVDDKNEQIDFATLTRDSLQLILATNENHNDLLEVEESMPLVFGSRVRMEQLVQNLLGNAIKFMGNQSSPKIKVGTAGVDTRSNYPIFFVSDNGIGIEPKFHDQVFGLFNRLHPELEGTGVGLTLVKRIIELQGGRIWIDSIGENKGTTFYFTLPPANTNDE